MCSGKGEVIRAKWHIRSGAYPGFCSVKQLGVFLLPPGWDASPLQVYVQYQGRQYPVIHMGEERHCESKVFCSRTQHNDAGQGSNPDLSIRRRAHTNHEATMPPSEQYNAVNNTVCNCCTLCLSVNL